MNNLINGFEEACQCWSANFSSTGYEVIFNERLKKQHKHEIKYILIGDNPGNDEKDAKEYFVGDAGLVTRLFFERFLVRDFDREVLCLNKTPISTSKTDDLVGLQEKQCCIYLRSQTYMAKLAYNLFERLNVPVIVCGLTKCHTPNNNGKKWNLDSPAKTYVLSRFFAQLRQSFDKNQDGIYLIKHFSMNAIFEDFKIDAYRDNGANRFFETGRIYSKELFETSPSSKKINCSHSLLRGN